MNVGKLKYIKEFSKIKMAITNKKLVTILKVETTTNKLINFLILNNAMW